MRNKLFSFLIVSSMLFMGCVGFLDFEPEVVGEGSVKRISQGSKTLYVGGAGSGNYSKIQSAIKAANPGDTVFVYNGIYNEDLDITKSINLIGENKKKTNISQIDIKTNRVNVSFITIYGAYALRLFNANKCNIERTVIPYAGEVINIYNSSKNRIMNNNVNGKLRSTKSTFNSIAFNSIKVIRIYESSNNNNISNNFVTELNIYNSANNKIVNNNISKMNIDESMNMNIKRNHFSNGGIFLTGNKISHFNSHIIPTNNKINNKPLYYHKNRNGITHNGISVGQIICANCSDINLTNLNINNSQVGIEFAYSNNTNIRNNDIFSHNLNGIYLYASSNNTISNNNISKNIRIGIYLYKSNFSKVNNNNIYSNGWTNIFILASSNNSILKNNISSNKKSSGIKLQVAKNVKVFNNNCTNLYIGIDIYISDHNKLINNICINITYGIVIDASDRNTISNNILSCKISDIWISFSKHHKILNNSMSSNGISFNRIFFGSFRDSYWDSHTIDANNTVNGKPVYYWKNFKGKTVPQGAGQIIVVKCKNIKIENQNISNAASGIILALSENITIQNCICQNNRHHGIFVVKTKNSIISNCICNRNNNAGINFSFSNKNEIKNCNFTENWYGVGFYDSSGNSIEKNIFYSNDLGIIICTGSFNNLVKYNIFKTNEYEAIGIWGGCRNNRIYLNNFFNNFNADTTSNKQCSDYCSGNNWNGSKFGNYWSDLNPIDTNNDGIVDTSYLLGGAYSYRDYYPLVKPLNLSGLHFKVPSPPRNLTAIAGDGYINLSWEPPVNSSNSSFINYIIYRGNKPDSESKFKTIGNVSFYNDTGLINGNTYYYNLKAKNIFGEGPFSNKVNATPFGSPSPPRKLNGTIGDGFVNLTWKSPTYFGDTSKFNYIIYRGKSIKKLIVIKTIGNITFYNDTTVINGQKYYYKVSAKNAIGEGLSSDSISVLPLGVPDPPKNIKAAAGDGYVQLSWTPPYYGFNSTLLKYRIYRGTTSGGETFYRIIDNSRFFSDVNVTNNVTYFYKISAVNATGEGPLSNEVSATPSKNITKTVPTKPRNLQLKAGDGYVYLSWSPPLNNGNSTITKYKIYRGNKSNAQMYLITIGNFLYFNDTNVTNNITYFYKVSAKNAIGEGPLSKEVSATPVRNITKTVPSKPLNLNAFAGDGFVLLNWNKPLFNGNSSITNYLIYKGTKSGNLTFHKMISNILYFNDTKVTNGNSYYYRVSAKNSIGEGPLSNEVSATPKKAPEKPKKTIPSSPRNLKATAGDGFVSLTWNSPLSNGNSSIINYKIYRGTSSTGKKSLHKLGTIFKFNDTNVTNNITYYYEVSAINKIGEGPRSNEVIARPNATIKIINQTLPWHPQNLTARAGDGFVNLTWETPAFDGNSTITNYRLYRSNRSGINKFYKLLGVILQYNDTNVSNDVTYYYRVSVVNKIGEGALSNEIAVTPKASQVQTLDSDNDGIPDVWEQLYGFNITDPNDAQMDNDSDNLTNLEEYLYSKFNLYFTDPTKQDTDDDGLPDGEEINVFNTDPTERDTDSDNLTDGDEVKIYRTNATNPDTDGDGYDDGIEIENNTDPLDENDYPGLKVKKDKTKPNNILIISVGIILIVVIILLLLSLLYRERLKKKILKK